MAHLMRVELRVYKDRKNKLRIVLNIDLEENVKGEICVSKKSQAPTRAYRTVLEPSRPEFEKSATRTEIYVQLRRSDARQGVPCEKSRCTFALEFEIFCRASNLEIRTEFDALGIKVPTRKDCRTRLHSEVHQGRFDTLKF